MRRLSQLAEMIRAELIGDPDAAVSRARPFDLAVEGDITFAEDAAYRARLGDCRATAILLSPPAPPCDRNLLVTANPKLAFARAIHLLHSKQHHPAGTSPDLIAGQGTVLGKDVSVHPRVTIGSDSVIGDRVTLRPGVVIGDRCRVGDDTFIHANVTLYDDCRVGSRVIIHSGAVIGADGFGFVPDEEGRQVKVLQLGGVIIEDDCEIGANCAIDRGGFGDTVLRRGVKLDNLIQVGHNCELGEDTVVAALAGFSGGTCVGRRCVIAGQVGTKQHIKIGDGAIITGQAGVTKGVPAGAVVAGMPAQDYNAWRRSQVIYFKLPEIAERLKRLEALVKLKEHDSDSEPRS